jgi:hypothetical protein
MTKWVSMAALVLALLGGNSQAAFADEDGCFWNLRECYYKAAGEASWADMFLRGLDCELEFVDCVRKELIGR